MPPILPPVCSAEDEKYMRLALAEAAQAEAEGEVPAGCIIIQHREQAPPKLVGRAHNMTESLKDPTAHAEVLAITQAAAALGDWRLENTTLYVTKEPCPMCGGAIILARISRVVWGIDDPKRGAHTVFHLFDHPGVNHHPSIQTGILQTDCLSQFQAFFRARRK